MIPVQHKTLDSAVLEAIARYIAAAGLKPGDKLPAERELAERLRVSRASVRESLKRWASMGIIETQHGSGSYLRTPLQPNSVSFTFTFNLEREALLRTLELRRALETEAAALAALRATEEDLLLMKEKLLNFETNTKRYGGAPEEDWEFHTSIYRASHNLLFEQMFIQLRELFHRFFEYPLGKADFANRSFALHRDLFLAVQARDPESARQRVLAILQVVEEDLDESL